MCIRKSFKEDKGKDISWNVLCILLCVLYFLGGLLIGAVILGGETVRVEVPAFKVPGPSMEEEMPFWRHGPKVGI